ncbi:MAG: hypothetical protein AAF750_15475 [Planctomycetota bacterium]
MRDKLIPPLILVLLALIIGICAAQLTGCAAFGPADSPAKRLAQADILALQFETLATSASKQGLIPPDAFLDQVYPTILATRAALDTYRNTPNLAPDDLPQRLIVRLHPAITALLTYQASSPDQDKPLPSDLVRALESLRTILITTTTDPPSP